MSRDPSYWGSRRYWVQTAYSAARRHIGYSVCLDGPSGLTITLKTFLFMRGRRGPAALAALQRANALADYLNEGGKL